MKNLKTYESFFSRLFGGKKTKDKIQPIKEPIQPGKKIFKPEFVGKNLPIDDERYMSKERLEEISDIIADCLQEIFDEYGISKYNGRYGYEPDNIGTFWNFEPDIEGGSEVQVKSGVHIYNISERDWDDLCYAVWDMKDKIEDLTGVRIDTMEVPHYTSMDEDSEWTDGEITISFPYYIQRSYSVSDERRKMGYQ